MQCFVAGCDYASAVYLSSDCFFVHTSAIGLLIGITFASFMLSFDLSVSVCKHVIPKNLWIDLHL